MIPTHKATLVAADIISGAAIAGAMMQWLPPFAALGGVIWYAIQIWESKTVQKWVRVHRIRYRLRRLVKAQVEVSIASAEIAAAAEVPDGKSADLPTQA